MKAPPKRKGNSVEDIVAGVVSGLNESPSEKEGKSACRSRGRRNEGRLNESPSEKEGKSAKPPVNVAGGGASMKVPPKRKGNRGGANTNSSAIFASMKVPPKRKGNFKRRVALVCFLVGLNESPSEKEGKC